MNRGGYRRVRPRSFQSGAPRLEGGAGTGAGAGAAAPAAATGAAPAATEQAKPKQQTTLAAATTNESQA